MGSLIPLLLLDGGGHSGNPADAGVPAVRRLDDSSGDVGAVEGKPTFAAPPEFTLDPALDYTAVFELESGTVRIQLFDDIAPVHSNNLVFLIEAGYYDDLTFHRVIPGQLAQTGDPSATNNGDAGYILPDEQFVDLAEPLSLADTGLIAMARPGGQASASQIFITISPQPQLDSLSFTPFGRVVEGLELVSALTPRNPLDIPAPTAGDRIISASIETVASGSGPELDLPFVSSIQQGLDDGAAEVDAPPLPDDDTGVTVTVDPPSDAPIDIGAVEGKPVFDAAPAITIDLTLDYVAVFELETGTVRIDLFEDIAPIHTNNFVFLAEQQFYDGLTFHRVIPGFMAQGGDPTALGTGGSGYRIPDEELGENTAALSLEGTGLISMARSGLGASGSQFFITYEPAGFLDSQSFTAFGQVVEGMDAVVALPPRDPAVPDNPAGGRILSVTIETAPKG
jgi:cyclophilin family peptidyl-prolyl cis-trans isomerase